MRQDFLRAILPSQGVYCAVAIDKDTNNIYQNFYESFDELNDILNDHNGVNVYVAPNSFKDYSRLSTHAAWSKSFFVDLDVGTEKPYKSKAEAIDSLIKFVKKTQLPPPIIIDSGTGIHAYWPFDADIPIEEWRPYAKLFKQFCINNDLHIDAAITADAARIMRCPDTFNYKTDPPNKSYVISEDIYQYSFAEFKEFLGPPPMDVMSVLAGVERGVDEESQSVWNRSNSNYENSFTDIVLKSLGQVDGEIGCAQIAHIINNSKSIDYNLWFAGLSIAARCDDSESAIHDMSEDYDGYTKENTEFKAAETLKATGPHKCSQFDEINPGLCGTCPHRGKITTPIELGRKLRTEAALPEEAPGTAVALVTNGSGVPIFPKAVYPFARGKNGGIYMIVPPDEDGTPQPALMIVPHDLYPIRRVLSPKNGQCMIMIYDTPHDGKIEYIINMKDVYSPERFSEAVMTVGVAPERDKMRHLMDYHYKWFTYMQNIKTVENMQTQMGFTDDQSVFVWGTTEIRADGTEHPAAASPYLRGLSKLTTLDGAYEDWRKAADFLNAPSMELHAFAMMCAFGSPLMHMTSVKGCCVSLYGPKGVAKTGALYSCLGVWGNPHELMVTKGTDNALTQRMLTLHNIPLGRDEVSNMDPMVLSNLIHSISSGKSKIRLQSTADAERELERAASMIALFTSNHALEAKLEILKANPEGEMARLVELFIDVKPALFADDPALSTLIFETFRICYGHAGPMYIKHLYKIGLHAVKDRINKWITKFRLTFGNDSAYRFYENLIAATFAGTELANEANIISFDLERIYQVVMRQVCSLRDSVPLNEFDYSSVVGEYIHKNTQNTLIIDGGRIVVEPRGELKVRVDVKEGTQTVSKNEFKKYIAALQISPREFETRVKHEKLLTDVNRDRLSKGWRNGNQTPVIYVYQFKAAIDDVVKDLINAPIIAQ